MIVNYKEEGWQVVTQRAHGIVAAQVATHWRVKGRPQRWTETLLAIAEHDDAENELDRENLLTPTGGPLNFDMKNFELEHCQKLSSLTIAKSRYIALLTSMHMVFLYRKDEATNREAKTFLDKQRKWQAHWRKELDISSEEAERAYSLLEWCDALSLLICKGEMQPEGRKLEISTGPDGKLYHLLQVGEKELTVHPWPFEVREFDVCFETRLVPQIRFSSSDELREAFQKAVVQEVRWTLKKTGLPPPKKKKS